MRKVNVPPEKYIMTDLVLTIMLCTILCQKDNFLFSLRYYPEQDFKHFN